MPRNTDAAQDRLIAQAEKLSDMASTAISDLTEIIENLDTKIDDRDRIIESLNNTISELEEKIDDRDAEIARLKEDQ